jgi:hypothetical protein
MGNMGNWMSDFKNGWDMVLNKLRPFIEGARVLEKMFGNIFRIVGGELADGFGHVNDLLKENRKDVEEFGSKIGNLITTLFKYGKVLRDVFFEALPFINKIVDGITRLLDTVFSLAGGIRSLFGGGGFSSFLMLAGAIAGVTYKSNGTFRYCRKTPAAGRSHQRETCWPCVGYSSFHFAFCSWRARSTTFA